MRAMNSPETLLGLLERYSPTGEELSAVEYLVARMDALGFTRSYVDEAGSAVGVMGSGAHQIVLLGHIDTVSGEIPVRTEAWVDPETGLEQTSLYGRGAVDAKGPLACFVDAAAQVGAVEGWQIVVIGAVDEEGDSAGARHAVGSYHPEYAIIGEPSHWERVTLGYKGSAWARVTVRRPVAHTASLAESACEAAFDAWQKLETSTQEMNAGIEKVFHQVQLALRGFSSGDDSFEEWAALELGARLPPGLLPQDWYGRLEASLPGAHIEPTGYAVPAFRGEKNTPLVRAFLAAIRQQRGTPGFVLKTGTADINIVAPPWGCPAVAYGPGDSGLDHTPYEHILLEEYDRAVVVLRQVIQQLTDESRKG